MPPTDDKSFFGIKVSKFGVPVDQATDQNLVYKDDFSTKTYFDSATARIVEGLLPDGNYGMWVSKPTFDVRTATANQLVFNSNQNIFKVVTSTTATIPAFSQGAGTTVWSSLVIPHGLSYIPILQAYGLVNQFINKTYPVLTIVTIQSYVPLPFNGATGSLLDSNITRYEIMAGVDATNVYFGWLYTTTSGGSGGTGYNFPAVPIRYYLLQETAS